MKIEEVKLGELKPYEKNARTHPESQIKQIARSIEEFGFNNPILATKEGRIIAGHGRVEAAKVLNLDTVPVVRIEHLSPEQIQAYTLADNQLALTSKWDADALANEIKELYGVGFDIDLLGFDPSELAAMLEVKPEIDESLLDEVPEVEEVAITKPGDLWELGDHRLLCGDSTKAEDVAVLMEEEKADLCFTSPPYLQQRDYTKEGKAKVADWDALMKGVFDNLPMQEDGQVLVNLGLIHRDGEWIPYWDSWIQSMKEQGWKKFGWYVWDQGPGIPGDWNGRLAPSFEFIWHFNKKSKTPIKARECKHAGSNNIGKGQRGKDGKVKERSSRDAVQSHAIHDSVIRVNRQGACAGAGNHPAPFPIGLPTVILESWPGLVFDPFLGSGTTLVAAEQLGRKCRGIEISPQYCDVIIKRWQKLTGKRALNLNTGDYFGEITE